jgi:DNA-binding PadR family transcriptional regulator
MIHKVKNPVEDESDTDDDDEQTARPWAPLTAFQRDILWVLKNEGEQKGLSIKESLEGVYGKEINHGRLYPNLDDLVDDGYVEKGRYDQRTNKYSLTSGGKATLADQKSFQSGNG